MKKIMISAIAAFLICGTLSAQTTPKKPAKTVTAPAQKAKTPNSNSSSVASVATAKPKPVVAENKTTPAIKRKHKIVKKKPSTKK